jgi:hypothetical protein
MWQMTMNNILSKVCIGFVFWGLLSTNTLSAAEARPIPSETLQRVQSFWIPLSSDLPEGEKIRQYQSLLREGRRVLRECSDAPNRYVVQCYMLEAARGLLILGVKDVDQEEVLALANGILESDAAPSWRLQAEILRFQLDMNELAGEEDGQEQQEERIRHFLSVFEGTEIMPQALMQACQQAERYGLRNLGKELRETLSQEYFAASGVANFLRIQGERVLHPGDVVALSLPLVDGGQLQVPRDTIGVIPIFIVWSLSSDSIEGTMKEAEQFHKEYFDRGLRVYGICVDANPEKIQAKIKSWGVSFPQAYFPDGLGDGRLQYMGIHEVPTYRWLDANGVLQEFDHIHSNASWKGISHQALEEVRYAWHRAEWNLFCRTGEHVLWRFLRDQGENNKHAMDLLHEIQSAVARYPRPQDRREAYGKFVKTLQKRVDTPVDGKKELIDATTLMVLSAWLDIQEDKNLNQGVLHLAKKIRGHKDAPVLSRVLADYYPAREAVLQGEAWKNREALDAFDLPYKETPQGWAAYSLGLMLATEAGQEGARNHRLHQLKHTWGDIPDVQAVLEYLLDEGSYGFSKNRLEGTFTSVNGKSISLPDALNGKPAVLHVFSAAALPGAMAPEKVDKRDLNLYALLPSNGDGFIGLGVDMTPGDTSCKEFRKQHSDWIFIDGKAWEEDALRRQFLGYAPPTVWVLGPLGTFLGHGSQENFWKSIRLPMRWLSHNWDRRIKSIHHWHGLLERFVFVLDAHYARMVWDARYKKSQKGIPEYLIKTAERLCHSSLKDMEKDARKDQDEMKNILQSEFDIKGKAWKHRRHEEKFTRYREGLQAFYTDLMDLEALMKNPAWPKSKGDAKAIRALRESLFRIEVPYEKSGPEITGPLEHFFGKPKRKDGRLIYTIVTEGDEK